MFGVAVSVVVNCIIGAVVYTPKLPTGKVWMRRTHPGKTAEQIGQDSAIPMGLSVVATATMSLLLRFILIDFFKVKVALDAVKFAVGLSCLVTLLEVPHTLFSKRSVDAFIVDQLHNIATMTAAAACIFYFG
ncbi:uncharacterized protein LOC101851394 isoform X2 [Aplysia californica]|nr:uncharacterized protein LOC101851394 isoform X2 [Aplysia californica]